MEEALKDVKITVRVVYALYIAFSNRDTNALAVVELDVVDSNVASPRPAHNGLKNNLITRQETKPYNSSKILRPLFISCLIGARRVDTNGLRCFPPGALISALRPDFPHSGLRGVLSDVYVQSSHGEAEHAVRKHQLT